MPGNAFMNLRIMVPSSVFAKETGVLRVVADTGSGSLGILPHRLDFVAVISPGILVYEKGDGGEVYIAVDEGIILKTGLDILVSVHSAVGGSNLKELQETVDREFLVLNEHEQNVRSVLSKMESTFIRRIAAFSHG